MPADVLAEINGIKPKVVLIDGEDVEVASQTSSSKYKAKRTQDHYYWWAWRNQAGAPTDARTCKHLKELLGEEYEEERIKRADPEGYASRAAAKSSGKKTVKSKKTVQPAGKAKPASKGKPSSTKSAGSKRKKDEDDDEDEDEEVQGGRSKKRSKKADEDEIDSDDNTKDEVMLANKWDIDSGIDPTGWWISEKLDGVRTYWNGRAMKSRLGNKFTPPKWLTDKLPTDFTLDGELFTGRGNFQDTVSIVKTMNSSKWKSVTFQIFDIPSSGDKVFEARVAEMKKLFGPGGQYACDEVVVLEHEQARDRQHVLDKLQEITEVGGEGLMLRKPGSLYEPRRSAALMKVKTFFDAEAEVIGYEKGHGKYAGSTGSLKCKMESGKTFNVGTGLSDKQRKNPPKIGSIIVYRFQELTRSGVPRFQGIAADKDRAKDAEIPPNRAA
ncbi:DNA ligase/mRNA capping enzyme [Peniophora sp. CONT]|nr:DNA ligase/mRNA capping enzyme [Peniophora sp. CONT]